MKNETLGKENFKNLIKQVYQQSVSLVSIEKQIERLSLIRILKNFREDNRYRCRANLNILYLAENTFL